MIPLLRVKLALLLAPCCLAAQVQLFQIEGGAERAAGAWVNVGTVHVSDPLDTRFRIRNAGSSAQAVWALSVSGAGFNLTNPPALPASLPGGGFLDFVVRFQPAVPGAFSAVLTVNTETVILRGSALNGPVVAVESGGAMRRLVSGESVDFGALEQGSSRSLRFRLENATAEPLRVEEFLVTGASFRALAGFTIPFVLAASEPVVFEIIFAPQAAGAQEGVLQVNGRSFRLAGAGLDPPFPTPRVLLDPPAARSGQQVKVSIRLASPSGAAGSGKLRLRFVSSAPGARDDPAIQFVSPSGRVVTFTVEEGTDTARFAGRTEAVFQTGTTAGTLVLTAELGAHVEEVSLPIAPQLVAIDSAKAFRRAGALEVHLTGFDNSHSVSRLVFTFYDRQGRPVDPGPIAADAASEFRRYFESSDVGGLFTLRATFPVTGDAALINAVNLEIGNAVGTARAERIPIENAER